MVSLKVGLLGGKEALLRLVSGDALLVCIRLEKSRSRGSVVEAERREVKLCRDDAVSAVGIKVVRVVAEKAVGSGRGQRTWSGRSCQIR